MALRKISANTEAELKAILGKKRSALMEVDGRRVLLQVIEEEFDLDLFLEDHPEAIKYLVAGVQAVEEGALVDHEEVDRASREKP